MTDYDLDLLNAKILIVDDEPANLLLLEKMLRGQGYAAVTATTDPRKGLEIYQEQPQDLLLLDLRMPRMDGFQFMEVLKLTESDNCPPILVLTAQADMPTRLRALESGARDFLTKPIERMEVLSRIRNLLEVRLMHKYLRTQNALLESKVRERTQELTDSRLEVVRRLGRAAEYRDNETGLHIIRMSKISAALARQAGLTEVTCDLILNASPMHDIGKIGIPDSILLKPGKLDAEEWVIMRSHTTIGAEILSGHDSDLMNMAQEIAIGHHEKWDGTGYPNGLAGENIPHAARITAVADVFDALTSERPYKKAWPVHEALREIDRLAGVHLDPELIYLFHDILPEVTQIREQYAEPLGISHLQSIVRFNP